MNNDFFNYTLTDKVKKFLENATLENINIGCSNSQVVKVEKNEKKYFLKVADKGLLTREYNALKWLDGKLSVPRVFMYEVTDNTEYLITESMSGEMICSEKNLKRPDVALKYLKDALERLYLVDIGTCPFDVSLKYKLSLVEKNVIEGLIKDEDLKPETLKKFGSTYNLLKYLQENRFDEDLCFSHGDTSLPNVFVNDTGFTGFIDVGECGVADKWFDLAICEKSIKRNFGEEYINKFYETLGIIPDRKKLDYYLLMMELYL